MHRRLLASPVFICLLLSGFADPVIGQGGPANPAKPSLLPMRLCLATCFHLTWNTNHYDAYPESGESGGGTPVATYTVVSLRPNRVVINRTGPGDFRAVLDGTLSGLGTRIVGGRMTTIGGPDSGKSVTFQATWGDAIDNAVKSGRPAPPARTEFGNLPPSMRLCVYNCFVLSWSGDHYDAYSETSTDIKLISTYQVLAFKPDHVLLNRDDLPETANGHWVLEARIARDGNSLVDGLMNTRALMRGKPGPFQASWGTDLADAVKIGTTPNPHSATHSITKLVAANSEEDEDYPTTEADQTSLASSCQDLILQQNRKQLEQPFELRRSAANQTLPSPHTPTRDNLNGLWTTVSCRWNHGKPSLSLYHLRQEGDLVRITDQTERSPTNGKVIFEGKFSGDAKILGKDGFNLDSSPTEIVLEEDVLHVDNPDTLTFAGMHLQMLRISLPGIDDAVCDPQNSSHILDYRAFFRASQAITYRNDYKKAACWIEAIASGRNPTAEGLLAYLYYAGLGVPQDYAKAVKLASDSASRGNTIGASELSLMYATGKGIARNEAFSIYWLERSRSLPQAATQLSWKPSTLMAVTPTTPILETGATPRIFLPPGVNPETPLAAESQDCGIDQAKRLTADQMWDRTRNAYAARQYPLAACWAFYSGAKGNIDAQRTIAWFFEVGIGVEPRDRAVQFWYSELARNGDLFGQAKLGYYYRISGIGRMDQLQTMDEAKIWEDKAELQPGGRQLVELLFTAGANAKLADLSKKLASPDFKLSLLGSFIQAISEPSDYEVAYQKAPGRTPGERQLQAEKAVQDKRDAETEAAYMRGVEEVLAARPLPERQEIREEMANIEAHLHPHAK